jgi:TRAP-type C4-dicarboxylate transport system permease small subunit
MLMVGLFMTVHGAGLCETTWDQSIAEFPSLSVGVTYLPIPLGGIALMLFVAEHLLIGRPADAGGGAHAVPVD